MIKNLVSFGAKWLLTRRHKRRHQDFFDFLNFVFEHTKCHHFQIVNGKGSKIYAPGVLFSAEIFSFQKFFQLFQVDNKMVLATFWASIEKIDFHGFPSMRAISTDSPPITIDGI